MILAQVIGDTCSYLLGKPLGKYHKYYSLYLYMVQPVQKLKEMGGGGFTSWDSEGGFYLKFIDLLEYVPEV